MIREQWRSLMASTFKGRGIPDSRLRELLDQWEGEDPQALAEAKVSLGRPHRSFCSSSGDVWYLLLQCQGTL